MFTAFERMMAFRYLRARRREGFISVIAGFSLLGICLGVATLIIVMAVMNGFRSELLNRILGISSHITVTRFGVPITDYEEMLRQVQQVAGVTQAAPVVDAQAMVMAGGESGGAVIKGMAPEDLRARTLVAEHIVAGDLARFEGKDVVLIGSRMARRLGARVGDRITLIAPEATATIVGAMPRLKEYTVIGVFEVGMFEYDSSYIFMPLPAAQLFFRYPGSVTGLEVMVEDMEAAPAVGSAIEQAVDREVTAVDWKQLNKHFFNSLKVERNVMFLILTLIILVAAFNIISSMIMLVNDKSKAIAILRTMGATPGAVMRIFFLCGSAIGVLGTLLGFLLGLGFASNIEVIRGWLEQLTGTELFAAEIYFLSTLPAEVQADDVVLVVGMALALSFLATLYPAWRAARISPAEGVRYE